MIDATMRRFEHWRRWRRWHRRFGTYQRSAFLGRPELLVNPGGIHLSWGVSIRPHARLECVEHAGKLGCIDIAESVVIQFYFHCAAAERVSIGRDTVIAGRVYITDHDHQMPVSDGGLVVKPVTIGEGCWLGEGCAILKGVELGDHCVVGTNAVVTKSFPARSIIAGVPAKVIGETADKPFVADLPVA